MAKGNYFLAKDLAKVYVYMICIESRPMSKSMFTRKEGNPKYMTFVSCVLRMISRPWAFCECIGEFEKRSNLSYRSIFRESLAKVLLKPWRKTAFIWRLGGLNCGLAKTSVQEVGTAVWAWKCQNWPMKVSKDQNTMQKDRIWMCSHHRKITVAHLSAVLFDTRLMYRER